MFQGSLTDVKGLYVGHSENKIGSSGTTVILIPDGATCGVDVRGSAPGTRETDLLKSENLVSQVHGICLSGGSAFGLDAASGVMAYCKENKIGLDMGICKIPIVPGAVIFDLGVQDLDSLPDADLGYQACQNARPEDHSQGNVGAGLGATVGKYLGMDFLMKSGLGQASIQVEDLCISSLVVVNSFGDIYNSKGQQIAGVYDRKKKKLLSTLDLMKKEEPIKSFPSNTTIGLVSTNGNFSKVELNKIAQMAHNGYARSIQPVHTMRDGDTIFALSKGEVKADLDQVGTLAGLVVSMAIENAIDAAQGLFDIPARKDL